MFIGTVYNNDDYENQESGIGAVQALATWLP